MANCRKKIFLMTEAYFIDVSFRKFIKIELFRYKIWVYENNITCIPKFVDLNRKNVIFSLFHIAFLFWNVYNIISMDFFLFFWSAKRDKHDIMKENMGGLSVEIAKKLREIRILRNLKIGRASCRELVLRVV